MSALAEDDRRWLAAAARMARPFVATTGRNPCVGALVIDPATGIVVGHGVTAAGGQPHAEPIALNMAGRAARGATLYVTLEPCFHPGSRPPCVEAVIAAGVGRAVIALVDPDPRTDGKSIERFRREGVEVALAEPGDNPPWLLEGYLTRRRLGRPFVAAKLAVSADGMVGRRHEPNVTITGEAARRFTHALRARHDAILIGAETARSDDPRLDVRVQGLEARAPTRWVALGKSPADPALGVFAGAGAPTGVLTADPSLAAALPAPIERLEVAPASGGIDWADALGKLGERGTNAILVEGGPATIQTLLAAGLVDRFYLYRSRREVGADGVSAGDLETALPAAGLARGLERALGEDRLTVYERRA